MAKNTSTCLQPLLLSQGCQSLSNPGDTDWIFSFIQQHHTPPDPIRDRDMWLFKSHEELEATTSIWCIPKDDQAQERHWVVVGERCLPEETEVLIFVKDAICYTLAEYLELACGEPLSLHLLPDIVYPES